MGYLPFSGCATNFSLPPHITTSPFITRPSYLIKLFRTPAYSVNIWNSSGKRSSWDCQVTTLSACTGYKQYIVMNG